MSTVITVVMPLLVLYVLEILSSGSRGDLSGLKTPRRPWRGVLAFVRGKYYGKGTLSGDLD